MKRHAAWKRMVRYRFKDRMGCVWFQSFKTDREAWAWYEKNKLTYSVVEFANIETMMF